MGLRDEVASLKDRLEDLKTLRARDEGALAEGMQRLKREFGVASLDAARKLYDKQRAALEKDEAAVTATLAELEDEVVAMERRVVGG